MKKLVLLGITLVFLFGIFAVNSFGQENISIRKVFAGSGEYQRFVDFNFEVPRGACGQVETYQWIKAYPFFGERGTWEKKNHGEMTEKGWYRFVNNDIGCSTIFKIEGSLDSLERHDGWWVMELEPEEIGLFVKDQWFESNIFRLPTDDRLYSYFLVAPGDQMTTSLEVFFSGNQNEFVYMIGQPVGIILADSRGFLKKIVWKKTNKKGEMKNEDIVFGPDDVIILIYKEPY